MAGYKLLRDRVNAVRRYRYRKRTVQDLEALLARYRLRISEIEAELQRRRSKAR
jgi:hypothetical protein